MAVYKRTGIWYVDYYFQGKRVRESTRCVNRRAAGRYLASRLVDIERGKFNLGKLKIKAIQFDVWSKEFLLSVGDVAAGTVKSYRTSLNHLLPVFGSLRLSDITPFHIEQYKTKRIEGHASPASVNRELDCMKKIFRLAIHARYVNDNPVKAVKKFREENQVERILKEEEEVRLLNSCGLCFDPRLNKLIPDKNKRGCHLKPIVIMALDTGMRLGEILKLRWERVDLENALVKITKTKNGKQREVPLSERLLQILSDLRVGATGEWVFYDRITGEPFNTLKRSFKTACKRAGIDAMRFHDLRHTFASRLVARGVDIRTVQELLGHSSVQMTMRYTHTSLESKRRAIMCLPSDSSAHNGHKSVTTQIFDGSKSIASISINTSINST